MARPDEYCYPGIPKQGVRGILPTSRTRQSLVLKIFLKLPQGWLFDSIVIVVHLLPYALAFLPLALVFLTAIGLERTDETYG